MAKIAQIKKFNGAPTLFVDNNPLPPFWLFGPVEVITNFAKKDTGIHLFQFVSNMGWIGSDKYDYSEVDAKISKVISADSKALIVLQVDLNTPDWWNKLHPEELTIYKDEDKELYDKSAFQSYASDLWKDEAGRALDKFVKHTRGKYSDNVIGFSLGVGFAGEWHKDLAQEGIPWDYSNNMEVKFKEWLLNRYNNDLTSLKKSWNNDQVSFENVKVPPPHKHLNGDLYLFHDPQKSKDVIDYFIFRSELVIDTAIHFCIVLKKASENQCVAGLLSIGYIMDQMPGAFFSEERFQNYDKNMTHNWSQSCLYKLIQSEYVDFIGGWTCNLYRSIGGDASSVTVPESIMLHGKLYYSEFDARTYLAGDKLGIAKNAEESVEVNRRDFLNVWLRGAGKCAANLGPGTWYWPNVPLCDWYDDPLIVKDMAETQKIAEKSMGLDRSPSAEIAVVVDEESQAYHTISDNLMYPLTTKFKTYELCRIGAPYNVYLLNDVLYSKDIPNYKMYIMLNSYSLDNERRDLIRKRIFANNKSVVWMYAAGLSDGNTLSAQNMEDITGFKLVIDDEQWGINVTITNHDHPFTHDLETNLTFGTDNLIGPIIFCKDPEAIILGKLYYSNGRSEPGMCVKNFSSYTSIWCAAPIIPAKLLRNIALYSGVHVFNDQSDVLYANRNFIAIHTNRSGKRHIKLPCTSDVYDVFDKKIIAYSVNGFIDYIPANKTKLYYYGGEKRIF